MKLQLTFRVLLGLFMVMFISACGEKAVENNKLTIVSTIGMIDDVVGEIVQDKINHSALMGPGIDPHLYKASQGDVKTLADADIIFYNGLHLESKMIDIFEKLSSQKQTVAVTQTIPKADLLVPADYDGYADPHVWFDVSLWIKTVDVITQTIISADPKNKAFYLKTKLFMLTN